MNAKQADAGSEQIADLDNEDLKKKSELSLAMKGGGVLCNTEMCSCHSTISNYTSQFRLNLNKCIYSFKEVVNVLI